MVNNRLFVISIVNLTLLFSSVQSDDCTEKIENHLSSRIYKRSILPQRCPGPYCTHWGYGEPYNIPFGPRYPWYDGSVQHHISMLGILKTRQVITCGVNTSITLPLREQEQEDIDLCDFCDEASLEIKQLDSKIIPDCAFSDFKHITALHLNNLGIKYISEKAFDSLDNCAEIYLSGNHISEISTGTFNTLENLTVLDLSLNTIRDINRYMFDSTRENHISLNLSHNQIDLLDEVLFDTLFQNLSSLDLSFNKIVDIIFTDVETIVNFDISHNSLSRISGCFYKIPRLNMSHNNIESIENMCFNESLSMNYLDLSHNKITNLNYNTFPEKLGIKTLLLHFNKISNFSVGTFSNLMQLNRLNLSHNHISFLPHGAFENLGALKYLDISNNNLKQIYFNSLHSLHSLNEIYVQNNEIGNFDYKALVQLFPKLQLINLDNNNFTCDQLIEMIFHLKKHGVYLTYGSTKYSDNIFGIACRSNSVYDINLESESEKSIQMDFVVEKTTSYYQQISIFWIVIALMTLLLLILTFQTYIMHYKCQFRNVEDVEMV